MQSFWEKERENHKEFDKIDKDLNVSVCIVGGGFSGLSTAYYLSKNMSVVVLEKDRICSHTSGKNTGKITSQHGLFYKYLIDSESKEYAEKYLKANEEAINNIEQIIANEDIKCDFIRTSAYVFTQDEEELNKIKDEKKAVDKLEKDKSKIVKNISLPIEILGAIEFENQAEFHPLKYGYGLSKGIIRNNGKIYENSMVTDIKREDEKYIVTANNYKITADYVVIATRYPFIKIPGYYFLKMYQSTSYAIVADCKEELFEGMYINSEQPTLSFRTVLDGNKKLLLAVGYDYKTGIENLTDGYFMLENTIKKMYPNAEILYKWSAEDCISLDKIPYIGRFSNMMPNMYVATGFNKWGITSSNLAGKIISDEILGEKNEYAVVFKSTRMEPVKNKDELGNMIKEANKSIILSKVKIPKYELDDIKLGEGKVINLNNEKVGVYKSEDGKIYKINPICTHLGCELYFNNNDKIWECPCHGSKFSYDGKLLESPANRNIK